MQAAFAITLLALAVVSYKLWRHRQAQAREAYIRTFAFPKGVFAKVIETYPHLSQKDMALVSHGLRQFFLAYLKSGRQYVSMPSQVADALWHEFILYTRNYQDFTQKAFGGFLHHTPAAVLSSAKGQSNVGLRRCWRYVCIEENINPRKPSRLPLLFALDTKFHITNGFHYVPDCSGVRKEGEGHDAIHCGGDFSNDSVDGGTDGFSDNHSDSGSHHAGADHGHGSGDHGSSSDSGAGDSSSCGGGCSGGCGGD